MELSEIDLNLLLLSQPIEATGRTSDRLRPSTAVRPRFFGHAQLTDLRAPLLSGASSA